MGTSKYHLYVKVYWFLVLVRIFLVFVPQTGFIHPDEFFQSLEVLAGKILEVEYNPPWEFNSTFAIRSMALPYFSIGMSIKFLKDFNDLSNKYLTNTILTPYAILVSARFIMCLLSFLVDFCLYKVCLNNNEKYISKLVILASSYVMIVYATRTFSNTIELILFSVLLYFVCESLTFSNILIRRKEYIDYRFEQSKNMVEKVKFHKLRLFLGSDSFRNCFTISVVTVFGFFNRPTFVAFAVIPVFFWLYRGIGTKSVTFFQFHVRLCIFVFCSIPTFLIFILFDSFYYGYITWGEIGMLQISINNFVFTPLNFVRYNLDPNNLAKHGLHPRFLHILVNIPLLFNVLSVLTMASLLQYLYMCFKRKYNLLPPVRSLKCLMTLSSVTPIVLLSLFQHQEPRFLIPVILPLIYLNASTILPEPDTVLVEASKIQLVKPSRKQSYFLLKVWFTLNSLLTVFYGFIHQGGVYQATEYLSQDLTLTPLTTEFHVVTSHIYSIPESLLLQKSSNKLYKKGKLHYAVNRRVFLYEQGSEDISQTLKKLQVIVETANRRFKKKSGHFKVYLLISSSLKNQFNYFIEKQFLNFHLVETFYPHLSIEAFPDFNKFCLEMTASFYRRNCTILSHDKYFSELVDSIGLNLYQFTLHNI